MFECSHCLKKIQKKNILPICKNHLCNECILFILSTSVNIIFSKRISEYNPKTI
jgi:hypothetical protein